MARAAGSCNADGLHFVPCMAPMVSNERYDSMNDDSDVGHLECQWMAEG
jgi:hypothetical protein